MLPYVTTTILILGWCLVFATMRAAAAYWWVSRPGRESLAPRAAIDGSAFLPALIAGPIAVVSAFKVLGINLHVPVQFFATTFEMLAATAAPAFVLVVASGIWRSLGRGVRAEYVFWRAKPFATASLAMGRSPRAALRRLVLTAAMTRAYCDGLPWLFGELVIVETVFGAPGLGLDAWHLARTRDLSGLSEVLVWVAGLYLVTVAAARMAHAWVGRKLESYA